MIAMTITMVDIGNIIVIATIGNLVARVPEGSDWQITLWGMYYA